MQTDKITVYRDSPEWSKYDRWFMLPMHVLNDLYVCEYIITGEHVDVADVRRHAKEVAALHPGHVLVHI